jgi:choice-of-anchor A domain-containing protein
MFFWETKVESKAKKTGIAVRLQNYRTDLINGRTMKIYLTALVMLCFANQASANLVSVDLGVAQNFNLFAIGNLTSSAVDIQGAAAVGGNMNVSNYAVNSNNVAGYAGNALVLNGNLNFTNGYIGTGNAYVGGTVTTSGLQFAGSFVNGAPPLSFANTASSLYQLSGLLSGLSATGTATFDPWGGVVFSGDGTSNTQVFNVTGSQLLGINYLGLTNVQAGQSLIFNVSGSAAGFNAMGMNTAGYNVLFNFDQATQLALNNVGVFGSILAPYATATGGNGQVNGNVVVDNWYSTAELHTLGYFLGATVNDPGMVPVPATLALLLPGLGLIGYTRRRIAKNTTAAV